MTRERVAVTPRTAERLVEIGDTRSTVNRAYYAMFYAAQLYLKKLHFDETRNVKTHNGTATKFYELAVRRDGFPRELAAKLTRMGNDRIDFDYDDVAPPDDGTANRAVETAREFCGAVLAAVGDRPEANR